MRAATTLLPLAAGIGSFVPLVSAWPRWLPDVDSLVVRDSPVDHPVLHARQTNSDSKITTEAPKPTATGKGDEKDQTTTSKSRTRGSLNTAKPETDDDKKKETGTKTSSRKSNKTIPPDAPPGGVEMIEPTAIPGATELVKIGDYVDLKWNYTSLLSEPKYIDIILSCTRAAEPWTLTSNMSFATDASYLWNTDDTENDPDGARLLTEMYTLLIKDSEAEISEPAAPGVLGVAPAMTFGMYHKVPYTPLPDWECVGCNAASPGMGRGVTSAAYAMSLATVVGFTWFVTGIDLI